MVEPGRQRSAGGHQGELKRWRSHLESLPLRNRRNGTGFQMDNTSQLIDNGQLTLADGLQSATTKDVVGCHSEHLGKA